MPHRDWAQLVSWAAVPPPMIKICFFMMGSVKLTIDPSELDDGGLRARHLPATQDVHVIINCSR